jgi:hypothetical protein
LCRSWRLKAQDHRQLQETFFGTLPYAIVVLLDPLPIADFPDLLTKNCWHRIKSQYRAGLIAVAATVRGSGGSVDGDKPTMSQTLLLNPSLVSSSMPSFAFEAFLAQPLPLYSQDAILGENTPEAQAFAYL